MFSSIAVAGLNHLLASEPWARERLRPFAGQHAIVEAGPLRLEIAVDGGGMFVGAATVAEPSVVISLPPDTPFRYLADPASVFSAARLTGSADFAESLAFVFRHLRWDFEGDLARLVGDIPAHRLARAGQSLLGQKKQAGVNLATNVAEYITEEAELIASRRDLSTFCREVDGVRDDMARLEKRLARLA